jgi:hypothetical protein
MSQPHPLRERSVAWTIERSSCATAWLAFALIAAPIAAQDQEPDVPAVRDGREAPVIEPRRVVAVEPSHEVETAEDALPRTALIREGAYLVDAVGRLAREPESGAWLLRIEQAPHDDAPSKHLVVLPCERLQHMQRVAQATELDVVFQFTGRVFVFDNLNYVLPLDATRLERYEQPIDEPPSASRSGGGDEGEANADETPLVPPGATAQDVIDRLRRDIPLPRSLDAAPLEPTPVDGSQTPDPDGSIDAPMEEGTLITLRRGRVQRHAAGGWMFVFDADANGLADPPLVLLPCLLLEKMREDSLNASRGDGLIVTGEVFAYQGRNLLLPTMYRVERLRANIH